MVRPFEVSVRFSSFNHSDVLGVGIYLPCLVVNIHPASAHAVNLDSPTIYFYLISVDSRDGHLGGSVLGPPLNQ